MSRVVGFIFASCAIGRFAIATNYYSATGADRLPTVAVHGCRADGIMNRSNIGQSALIALRPETHPDR